MIIIMIMIIMIIKMIRIIIIMIIIMIMIIIIASVPCLGIRRCILRHYTDVDKTREFYHRKIIVVFAYTLYNISFTILDAHVGNTSPIHHQTLFMMYKYVKITQIPMLIMELTSWTQITHWHLSLRELCALATHSWRHSWQNVLDYMPFLAENDAFPYISHGFLQFWGYSKVFHAVKPRQSDCIIDI